MARPRSDIEPRIIRAAHDLFLREGVESASLRAIARSAGTNVGMVYYYFPTKDDLFLAVVEDAYVGLLKRLTEALAPTLDVEERLRRASVFISSMDEHELEVARIVLRELMSSTERRAQVVARFQRGHLPLVLETLSSGVQQGKIDTQLPFPLVMVCAAAVCVVPQMMLPILSAHLPMLGPLPQGKELADFMVRIFFHGVAPAAGLPAASLGGDQSSTQGGGT